MLLLHIVSYILSPYSHSLVVFIETDHLALLRLRLGRSINERFPTDSRVWLLLDGSGVAQASDERIPAEHAVADCGY